MTTLADLRRDLISRLRKVQSDLTGIESAVAITVDEAATGERAEMLRRQAELTCQRRTRERDEARAEADSLRKRLAFSEAQLMEKTRALEALREDAGV